MILGFSEFKVELGLGFDVYIGFRVFVLAARRAGWVYNIGFETFPRAPSVTFVGLHCKPLLEATRPRDTTESAI